MADKWFIADLHLRHRKIVEGFGDGRPGPRAHFGSIEAHDEAIIENWNRVVKPQDKVYVLGDLALSKAGIDLLWRLQGHKRAILGNHDQGDAILYAKIFEKVYGAKCLDGMILTHIPIHPSCLTRRSMQVNLHGHMHDDFITLPPRSWQDPPYDRDRRYQSVSCEQINYTPIHYDEVVAKFGVHLEAA